MGSNLQKVSVFTLNAYIMFILFCNNKKDGFITPTPSHSSSAYVYRRSRTFMTITLPVIGMKI